MNIIGLLFSFSLLIIAMTIHEFAHGLVAYKLGDSTAKYQGRLTLNPLAHIDPFWTVILPLMLFISSGGQFVFGAAKPVPINYWALGNPKKDTIWIGASGPLSNIIFALLLGILTRFIPLPPILNLIFGQLMVINVTLGIFNLIPIPPLDGSRIAMGLLPKDLSDRYMLIEPYGFIILMLFIWLGLFESLVYPIVIFIIRLITFSL